jgi:transposase
VLVAKGFRPVDRDQQFLLPVNMRDWLPDGHLVWFVLDTVAQLDLGMFRARHRLGGAGREAYEPGMLLALLIYGYAVGERSSRRIERLCGVDVAFRVICAQDTPDHTTIARFRKAHADLFEQVFAQVLGLCARAGMGRLGTVAIDGTKIAANASIDANHGEGWFREQARKIAAEADAADAAEDAEFGPEARGDELPGELADPATRAERIRRCLSEIAAEQAEKDTASAAAEAKAEQHLARLAAGPVVGRDPGGVDPVAAAQARLAREVAARRGEIDAYAAAVGAARAAGRRLPRGRQVVDPFGGKGVKKALAALRRALAAAARSGTTAGKDGTDGKVVRRNVTDPDSRIMPTRKGWCQAYNAQFAVSADYLILALALTNNPADVGELKAMLAQVERAVEVINRERVVAEEPGTALADAGYFSEDNLLPDVGGEPVFDLLIAPGKSRDLHHEAATNPAAGPPPEGASPVERMRHRLRTPEGAELYKKRGATVEPVNGHIKDRNRLRQFSMRGLAACLGELNLTASAHNVSRMFTTVGTAGVCAG